MSRRFSMFLLILIFMFVANGCAVKAPDVNFDDSHQLFLESVIGDLDVVSLVSPVIPKNSNVCVVSMETGSTVDTPLLSLLDDSLIGQLTKEGYTVFERDDDLIRRMISEGSGEEYSYVFFPVGYTIASSSASMASTSGYYSVGSAGFSEIHSANRDTILTIETNMKAADFIIAYRVLECGMVYRPSNTRGLKKREVQVRLHIRAHNAATGEILLATNLESRRTDQIDAESGKWLSNYHYTFFSRDLPVQQGNPRYKEVGGGSKKSTGGSSGNYSEF